MEYVKVKNGSRDPETLNWLYNQGLNQDETLALIKYLSRVTKVKRPTVVWQRKHHSESGNYTWGRDLIRVARFTNAETVVHEFAHHLHWTDVQTKGTRRDRYDFATKHRQFWHGWDFTMRLDKLAGIARAWFEARE